MWCGDLQIMKRIGFTCSTFDLLHAGHIMMLQEAKEHCDILIVGLQIDPTVDRPEKNKPIQSIVERFIQLKAIKYVDEIVPYHTENDLLDILKAFPIDIRFVGDEYAIKDFTGKTYCSENNIELFYNSRKHSWSTTELRNRIYGTSSVGGLKYKL